MDENIIIPIQIDKSGALAELARLKQDASARPVDVFVKAHTAPAAADLKALATQASKPIIVPIRVSDVSQTFLRNTNAIAGTSKAITGMVPGVRQADNALLNLNRVVQDAPYGFIGIANNLNPLLESFQRLRAETGSSSLAFKALGRGLMGAGGIGLAVAAVTTAVTFATMGFDRWTQKKREAKAAADEGKKSIDELAKSFADSAARLTMLVGITQSHTSSIRDKKLALEAINRDYKQYLTDLRGEKVGLENVAQAYDLVIDKMIRQAVVKGLQEQISKEVEKTAAQLVNLELAETKRQNAIDAATNKLKNQETTAQRLTRVSEQRNRATVDGYLAQERGNQVMGATIAYNASFEQQQKRIKAELMGTLKPLMDITDKYDDLGIALSKPQKTKLSDAAKETQRFAEYQKNLAKEIEYLESSFDKGLLTPLEFAKEKMDLLTKAARDFFTEFDQPADGALITGLDEQIDVLREQLARVKIDYDRATDEAFAQRKEALYTIEPVPVAEKSYWVARITNLRKDIELLGVREVYDNGIMVPVNLVIDPATLEASKEMALRQIEDFKNAVSQAAVEGLAGLGEGIGNAMAGLEGLGGIFNRVGSILGSAMQSFGKQMIQSGVTMIMAKKAMKALLSNPYTAIAAGIALVAVGTALKNSLEKKAGRQIGGFADGGGSYGPMLTWFGESPRTSRSNPELAMRKDQMLAAVDGAVRNSIKQNTYKEAAKPGKMQVEVVGKISGRDLVLIAERQNNYRNR